MLISGTCECVILRVKRELADVIDDIEMGRLSWVILVKEAEKLDSDKEM